MKVKITNIYINKRVNRHKLNVHIKFYEKLLEYNIPFIWSFSTDMPFAQIKSPPGGYGGLWTEDWQPKPVVDLLSRVK